jgi:hypothetical protein
LDHIWLSPALKPALKSGFILREARSFESPSDHVPVVVELAVAAVVAAVVEVDVAVGMLDMVTVMILETVIATVAVMKRRSKLAKFDAYVSYFS